MSQLLKAKRMLEQLRASVAESAAEDPKTIDLLIRQALALRDMPTAVGKLNPRNVKMLVSFALIGLMECQADVCEAAAMNRGEL